MTTTIEKSSTAKLATRRTDDQSNYELSGAKWAQRFKGSKNTKDLASPFRQAVDTFIDAMSEAGIKVRISATYRPVQRSYLMHWCWQIKYKYVKPENVPAIPGVDINWVHPTPIASWEAAKQMVDAFDMSDLNTAPALHSLHNEGRAIDMSISWEGTVTVKDADGKVVEVKTAPRSGMNSQLKAVGAGYGVKKFIGGAKDKPHWSATGR
ncbi:hypothetical protein ACFOLJ_12005 [Rugamonas sp. CCM 8940]|uniref:hypothetical protein n=1 Tax=Rugamonas sp. CCM 8940 TaxID=2765359 RepID=UPI0018F2A791|nr:hypothetical protein [Rugamonas sp. CCM 8940]MBJ7311535.1 hypothetical protein [Rugamonas sp. CCM 8940]